MLAYVCEQLACAVDQIGAAAAAAAAAAAVRTDNNPHPSNCLQRRRRGARIDRACRLLVTSREPGKN